MSRKPSTQQLLLLFLILSAIPFNKIFAQSDRATKGQLFLMDQRPRDEATLVFPPSSHPAFRTYNGKFNNLNQNRTDWGAADIILFRELPAAYGSSDPNNALGGAFRPSPRKISNVVIDEPITQFKVKATNKP